MNGRNDTDVKKMITGIVIFVLAAFGLFSLVVRTVDILRPPKKTFPVTVSSRPGKPGTPYAMPHSYDFSEMERTLKGIERQLERMNDITLKIHQEGR